MINLKVNLCGITIDNPIIPASGIFGYGYEFADYYDINCLGTFSFKGTTREARFGNPQPRIAEYDYGVLNATGLENPGVDAVIAEELPLLKKVFHKPVMANISGFSIDEYVEVAEKMSAEKQVGWLEVNISCPNVHGGGMAYGTDPKAAAEVTAAVRKVTKKPIILKLSPNVTDITEIAKACGGMSGPGIFPLALRMVWQVYKAVRIPIVGVGGIDNARGVIEMMMAGATAVQVGAANLVDPYVCPNIIKELPAVMKGLRINDINEIIGAAHGSDMHHSGNIAHGN